MSPGQLSQQAEYISTVLNLSLLGTGPKNFHKRKEWLSSGKQMFQISINSLLEVVVRRSLLIHFIIVFCCLTTIGLAQYGNLDDAAQYLFGEEAFDVKTVDFQALSVGARHVSIFTFDNGIFQLKPIYTTPKDVLM